MVFYSEAMLPANIAFWLPRVENHGEEKSARELEVNCAEEQCQGHVFRGRRFGFAQETEDRRPPQVIIALGGPLYGQGGH
jgi:hypothetical protein